MWKKSGFAKIFIATYEYKQGLGSCLPGTVIEEERHKPQGHPVSWELWFTDWRRRDVDWREKDEEAEQSGMVDPRALSRGEELESGFPENPDTIFLYMELFIHSHMCYFPFILFSQYSVRRFLQVDSGEGHKNHTQAQRNIWKGSKQQRYGT